ncbi:hypothetical protein C8R44DRAFT_752024 [Mycena epipterygia]|nr:hypothetical protein C8R44DRAFT_752024 [Mycena epipterygia]
MNLKQAQRHKRSTVDFSGIRWRPGRAEMTQMSRKGGQWCPLVSTNGLSTGGYKTPNSGAFAHCVSGLSAPDVATLVGSVLSKCHDAAFVNADAPKWDDAASVGPIPRKPWDAVFTGALRSSIRGPFAPPHTDHHPHGNSGPWRGGGAHQRGNTAHSGYDTQRPRGGGQACGGSSRRRVTQQQQFAASLQMTAPPQSAPPLPNAVPHQAAQTSPGGAPVPHHSALPQGNAGPRSPPPPLADADTLDGHPQLPFPDDVSSFLESDVNTDGGATAAEAWVAKETTRLARAAKCAKKPRTPTVMDASLVGLWHGLTIDPTHHPRNLMNWSASGCPFSWAMIQFLEQFWGLRPLERRSAGIGHLLNAQKANLIVRPTPPSLKATRRAAALARSEDAEMPPAPAMVVTTDTPILRDAVPTTSTAATFGGPGIWAPAYLGTSPPGNDGGTLNSRSTVDEAAAYWEKVPTSHWHRGMRNEHEVYPTAIFDRPLWNDVHVVLTLELFGPGVGEAREEFTANTMAMFSCSGMFGKYVRDGGYPEGTRGTEHYNFRTDHLDWSQNASWCCTHGLVVGSDDVRAMESFAMLYRNQATNDLPSNFVFVDYPNDTTCVNTLSASEITPWNSIIHAELHPGLVTLYPRRPAGAPVNADDLMTASTGLMTPRTLALFGIPQYAAVTS